MTRYAEEIVEILSNLEIEQIDLFARGLSIDDVKILHVEVLSKIKDSAQRRQLRKLLNQCESQIDASSAKENELAKALQHNNSVSEQLKAIFESITIAILARLSDQESRQLFLERAHDDDLFILEHHLNHLALDEQGKALQAALEVEIIKRENLEPAKDWRKNHENLQWKSRTWQHIIKNIKQVNLEISSRPLVKEPVAPVIKSQRFWLFRVFASIWFALKIVLYAVGRLFTPSPKKPVKNDVEKEPYKLELLEKEQEAIESMRKQGAQHVTEITGITPIGEQKRTQENIETTIMSRFGMVLSSQMVAGTRNNNHRDLYNVIESLTQQDDDDATIEKFSDAIKAVIKFDPENEHPLQGEHAHSRGGYAELVTAIEAEVVSHLVKSPDAYSQYGLSFSEEEKSQLMNYHKNLKRSKDLSFILRTVTASWGGYEEDKEHHGYKKSEKEFDKKQKQYEETLLLASKALQRACINLKDGESLILETGLEGHAMQLVIKKKGNEFKLSTYDSSGALENTSLSSGIMGLIKLYFMNDAAMRKNSYTFSVPQERLISEEGLGYLGYLIRTNSMAGWAQTHIELDIKHTTIEERAHMGIIREWLALRQQSYIYSNYMEKFASLASPQAPAQFEDVLQRPQNTQNCFAKKAQSCELYELGKPAYKKFRLAMLLEQRKNLLQDILGKSGEKAFIGMEYIPMLKNIEPEYLSPSELHEVSMRLCEIKKPPTKEYYQKYFQALLEVREKLTHGDNEENQLAIKRIDVKIASHAQAYYSYLKKGNRQQEIEAFFAPEVYNNDSVFNWNSGVIPLKTDSNGVIEATALDKLSEHANALAWKASIQLINHQIKKLSINERYINSPSERLQHASYREASSVPFKALENANIVTFTEGFSRRDHIKLEIEIGGTRKEIDKATFFQLVVKNKAALTNPKIIGLLDNLRNASPDIEKRYAKEVYPKQRNAFEEKLKEQIEQTSLALNAAIIRLSESQNKLNGMLGRNQEHIDSIVKLINEEQVLRGSGKQSTTQRNLLSRLTLLQTEHEELTHLEISVATKIQNLKGNKEVEGSSESKITKAKNIHDRLRANDPDLQAINAVSHAFINALNELNQVNNHVEKTINIFEIEEIEQEVNERATQINQYRRDVITHHLETNAEYRILDGLSAGKMGTEKNRNKDMYTQSAAERAEFFKQGRNTFHKGSVFQEIQSLSQRLKTQASGIVERKVILSTNNLAASSIDSLESGNEEYANIERQAQQISKNPLPKKIKKEWVKEMFAIWLKHENPEHLYGIQKRNESNLINVINQEFHKFIEDKADIKYAALKEAGYQIDLTLNQLQEMGWKIISEPEITEVRELRKKMATLILRRYKEVMSSVTPKANTKTSLADSIQLTDKDLVSTNTFSSLEPGIIVATDVKFLSKGERKAIDGSTLKFLRETPLPHPKGSSQDQCDEYFKEVAEYLQKLKTHNGLENKGQRIAEFCHLTSAQLFELPISPPQSLVKEIAHTIVDRYRNEEGLITASFNVLENNQRTQILTSLLKLNLVQIQINTPHQVEVNSTFYSTLKQWEKLLNPSDVALSKKIALLSSGGTFPEDISLLKEVDNALHQSPVSLEKIYEGQKGLQSALTAYGDEKEVNPQLRKLADRLSMRNGDALLALQFLDYYSDPEILFSIDGINSTQGRELFSRALLDAFNHANTEEKHQILNFLQVLQFDETNTCKLKTPHQVFIDEVLIRCSNIDPQLFQENTLTDKKNYDLSSIKIFISSLTDTSSADGADRLFGFAKEINTLALKIEHAFLDASTDPNKSDELYSQLICANLAYQLLLDQISEEVLSSLNDNFEYVREMALVQTNLNELQVRLVEFSSHLDSNNRASIFNGIFSEYLRDKKFDGPKFTLTSASSSEIPGFINLGGNKNLDVLHGVIYLGNNKLGVMPAFIQSHIALQELGINNLPFKPQDGAYVYIEGNSVKASIIPQSNGNLVIQRELKTLDGSKETLQYLSPDLIESMPLALSRRINASHFFIDANGAIHAFSSDFTPVLKLSNRDRKWSGAFLDHNAHKVSIDLDNNDEETLTKELTPLLPSEEMIRVNKNTVYVPSIAKYIMQDGASHCLIADNLLDTATKRHLQITEQGSGYTEKVLTFAEVTTIQVLTNQIAFLKDQLPPATKLDLLSNQTRNKLEKQIKDCEVKITEIKSPEYFVFVPDSDRIKLLNTELLKLRAYMEKAYLDFKDGGKDKDKLAAHYEQAKEHYLKEKKTLQHAYVATSYLRAYSSNQEHALRAKDFLSILHVGFIAGKSQVLTQLLGANIPQSPLKSIELEELTTLKKQYKTKESLTMEERFALIMLIGTELQHHLLEREACATGKLSTWNRQAYRDLLKEFTHEANQLKALSGNIPLNSFSELWRTIQSEFESDEALQQLFTKPVTKVLIGEKKPININTKTVNMPIESIGGRNLVEFNLYTNPHGLIDESQVELEKRLDDLQALSPSVQAQKEGYYYENYGLFNASTLERLFSITSKHAGIEGLTQDHVAELFHLMQSEGWIRYLPDMNQYQITRHPSDFYSSVKIASYLVEAGFDRRMIQSISDRLEIFLYQTAVSGGNYSVKAGSRNELIGKIKEARDKYNMEYLQAMDKIESVLAKSSSTISFNELNAAYLLNDYSRVLPYFTENERTQITIVLNNAMTRLLFYKTELDHIQDVHFKFSQGQDSAAIAMLHTRRNYQLDKLLESELSLDKTTIAQNVLQIDQDQKMQRAFLLFESEFGHRCNARQVNIFRGLLLDDETNPDKIDSAQARMGFGKTSLLPLTALYKTGDKLVRIIVPKSALETNTADMSATLGNLIGSRAVKDNFQRFRIASDPTPDMGLESPRLKSLQDAKADLQKRLYLYKNVQNNKEVLLQAPSVRNSLECQTKIFLDMLPKINNEPLQQRELMECLSLINEIRSITTVSVYDELDATQDRATTDVNYTSGEKIPLDPAEIYPLEVITQTIRSAGDRNVIQLGRVLLEQFHIEDADEAILNYVTSLQVKKPDSLTSLNSTPVYLIRAILSDPVMLSIFTEKEPGTDFGVWFQNASDGSKVYDYDALKNENDSGTKKPLLIAVPYSAANTPKPQGSRFDNPEVTAITTFLYYLDPRTELSAVPHLEFLIDSFRNGLGEASVLNHASKEIAPEFLTLFNDIKLLAEIEDPIIRNAESAQYFAALDTRIKNGEIPPEAFRKMLARTIIQEQIKFDAGKANSNRYEQGTTEDKVIGFSGTAGDTSSYFKENMLDPAADGNMTLGIMGRENCQGTIPLDIAGFTKANENFTSTLIQHLVQSFLPNTRALIDVGGLCKASNYFVAKELAIQLKHQSTLKGVIFYDDVTNTKKLLTLDVENNETIVDLTAEMVSESDQKGIYFTYYDQSHSRGADIKQMDGAHAVLTLNFTVTNNDYKQAIMRMRKIVDKTSEQSFSTAIPEQVRVKIIEDLELDSECTLTGNDVALWLRKKELQDNLSIVSLMITELESVIKNAILQQQAEITRLMSATDLSEEHIIIFTDCIRQLDAISPFISGNANNLQEKYGNVYGTVQKDEFIKDLKIPFEERINTIFNVIRNAREELGLATISEDNKQPYLEMEERIIINRAAQLSPEFIIPSTGNALSEVQSETESQSESQSQSQSQSQTQTHSFSEVTNEEVIIEAFLRKHDLDLEPVSIAYFSQQEEIDKLPLASQTAQMESLFKDTDEVSCSRSYLESESLKHGNNPLLPPVHYFVAREEGNPKVILINQDEANLFKNAPVFGWSLYDIQFKSADTLLPITGPAITSLKAPLLKKLNFAAFKYQLTGNDVESLAQSVEGICTPNQLRPSLSIQFDSAINSSREEPLFSLSHWGFSGNTPQDISIHIAQTQIPFKDKYEKRGVTVSVGARENQAEIFISSKLNKRILAEAAQQKTGNSPSNSSKLKKIVAHIREESEVAMKERKSLREKLKVIKEKKKTVTIHFDTQIAELQSIKEEAISQAKHKIEMDYKEDMKSFLNCKVTTETSLSDSLDVMCRAKLPTEEKYGIRVFGTLFPSLSEVITYCYKELYKQDKETPIALEQLNEKLNAYIKEVFIAAEKRYEFFSFYKEQNPVTLLEAMFIEANKPAPKQPKRKGNKQQNLHQSNEIKIGSLKFENVLLYKLYDLEIMDDIETGDAELDKLPRKWGKFVAALKKVILDARGKNLSLDDFYDQILNRIKKFARENKMDVDSLTESVMTRLCYALNANSNKKDNIELTKSAIENIVKNLFLGETITPSEEQVHLFSRIHDALKEKIDNHEYELPARFMDYEKQPVTKEEISAAVQEALKKQSIRTVKKEEEYLSRESAAFLNGRISLEGTLNDFKPVENRSHTLEDIEGQRAQYFENNFVTLTELDAKVLEIQKQLDEAKTQKKAQLAELEKDHIELRVKLDANNTWTKELQGEKSAINKLLTGVKQLVSVFTSHQVALEQTDPLDCFDAHFDLSKAIRDNASASGTLTFLPPDFYDLEENMDEQLVRLHGLNEHEASAKYALNRAVAIVKKEAAEVQPRASEIHGLQSQLILTEEQRVQEMKAQQAPTPSDLIESVEEAPIATLGNQKPSTSTLSKTEEYKNKLHESIPTPDKDTTRKENIKESHPTNGHGFFTPATTQEPNGKNSEEEPVKNITGFTEH